MLRDSGHAVQRRANFSLMMDRDEVNLRATELYDLKDSMMSMYSRGGVLNVVYCVPITI